MWVLVKGGKRAIEVSTQGLRNVDSLLKKVKEEVKPDLDHVAIHHLNLYQTKQTFDDAPDEVPFRRFFFH